MSLKQNSKRFGLLVIRVVLLGEYAIYQGLVQGVEGVGRSLNCLQQIAQAAVLEINRNRLGVAKLCQFASSTGAMLYLPTLDRAEWLMSIRQAICLMISGEWH